MFVSSASYLDLFFSFSKFTVYNLQHQIQFVKKQVRGNQSEESLQRL